MRWAFRAAPKRVRPLPIDMEQVDEYAATLARLVYAQGRERYWSKEVARLRDKIEDTGQ